MSIAMSVKNAEQFVDAFNDIEVSSKQTSEQMKSLADFWLDASKVGSAQSIADSIKALEAFHAVKPPIIPAPPSPALSKFELEKQAAQVLANTFNQAFADPKVKASSFEILGPVTTSVKTNKGTYATAPLFMGQKFGLSSAYVGKKNDVILVFNPKSPLTQYSFMEMKLDAAIVNLDPSFKTFISDLSKNGFNISNVEIKTPADLTAAQNQQRMTDPRFGAW